MQVVLRTKLNVEECLDKLRESAEADTWLYIGNALCSFFRKRRRPPIVAKISGIRFRLARRKWYINWFESFFYGRSVENAARAGSVVEGEFRMWPVAVVWLYIWFGCMVWFDISWMWRHRTSDDFWSGSLVLLSVGLLLVAFVLCGRWLARSDEKVITEFLRKMLDAELEAGTRV